MSYCVEISFAFPMCTILLIEFSNPAVELIKEFLSQTHMHDEAECVKNEQPQ
jgi:hypothetical protein